MLRYVKNMLNFIHKFNILVKIGKIFIRFKDRSRYQKLTILYIFIIIFLNNFLLYLFILYKKLNTLNIVFNNKLTICKGKNNIFIIIFTLKYVLPKSSFNNVGKRKIFCLSVVLFL